MIPDESLVGLTSYNMFYADFHSKQHQNDHDGGTDESDAVFHHETGADVVAEHVAEGARNAEGEEGVSAYYKYDEGGDVGGEVNGFGLAVSALYAEFSKYRECNDEKGSCSRAVESVIEADDKSCCNGGDVGSSVRNCFSVSVIFEEIFVNNDEGCHRQHEYEHCHKHFFRYMKAESRSHGGANDCCHDGWHCDFPVNETLFYEPHGGDCGSAGAGQLVSGYGHVCRESRQKVGRKGYESSSTSDGIHKSRNK